MSDNLVDGTRITVHGSRFQPGLAAVAVGLCVRGYTNGLTDCDLNGGARFVDVGRDGALPEVVLTARRRFNDIDCATRQCVIAAAPLPGTEPATVIAANSAQVPVRFAGSVLPTPADTVETARVDGGTRGPSAALWGVTAALLLVAITVALVALRRL